MLRGVGMDSGATYGVVASSFWDMETSGLSISDGGTGLSSTQMQDISTYRNAGWDLLDDSGDGTCDFWQISPGEYPRLWCQDSQNLRILEGLGTVERPYLIRDVRDLGVVWSKPFAHYRMDSSVDLSGISWSTSTVPWFAGVFDGNGHIISNLRIRGCGDLGLFGQTVPGASVSHLVLEAADVDVTGRFVGALVGRNSGNISESHISGTVISEAISYLSDRSWSLGTGALVGLNEGSISTCYGNCAVEGSSYNVGGLIGLNLEATVRECYALGSVVGYMGIGGLVGQNANGWVTWSYSAGRVEGSTGCGGLVGIGSETHANSSFWGIETSGQTTSQGGIGLTTTEMQTASTFLDAGWDFVDETENGTDDIWWILEGQDYPRLWWELEDEVMAE